MNKLLDTGPLPILKVYPAVPPVAATVKAPVESPLHSMLIWLATALLSVAGWVTVIEELCVHPPASVTVTV